MSEETPKRYWRSLNELHAPATCGGDEFPEVLDGVAGGVSRRGFLRATGFTAAAATMAGCSRIPVQKAIPYLVQPEEIVPGKSYFYSSTCGECAAACGIQVKCRDGRPIKLEGNRDHPVSRGGLCAVGQASLLGLYDSLRLHGPVARGNGASWPQVDQAIREHLESIRQQGGGLRFLSRTINSPTLRDCIRRFLENFRDAVWVEYDALSASAILDAHEQTHGVRAVPRYRFDHADVIISFQADFLGAWLSPVEHTAGWRSGRQPDANPPRFSYHVQFESLLTLTGAKADRRYRIAPEEAALLLTHLASRTAALAGESFEAANVERLPVPESVIDGIARQLWAARGRSLVACGSQDLQAQLLTNFINHLLGNYGATLDLALPSHVKAGNDKGLQTLRQELEAHRAAALFVLGANPVYELPGGAEFGRLMEGVPLTVSFAERLDETARHAHYVCPDHHFLESWGDAEAASGVVSLSQPAVQPLFATRPVVESLAAWSGQPKTAYEILQDYWKTAVFARQKKVASFQVFWDQSLERGFAEVETTPLQPKPFQKAAVRPVNQAPREPGSMTLVLYSKPQLPEGRHAYNPWLQELPDPVTKIAWDNYATLSPAAAARLNVSDGDVVRLSAASDIAAGGVELPVLVQPGQHDGVVGVPLGYGSELSRRFEKFGPKWWWSKSSTSPQGLVGVNAAPLLALSGGMIRYTHGSIRLARTGEKRPLVSTQTHNTLTAPDVPGAAAAGPRPIIQETVFPILAPKEAPKAAAGEDLWPADHPETGHQWGMAIDLAACTGCSACVVACQAENNIPAVGKDEVERRRIMHWIRIDRYYSGDGDNVDAAFQPMLCQQCGNAPCETVCPSLATVHSAEGLNQQIYNRCVGTRYCANNCPYKVRRFNWFDYPHDDRLANLALNPDVTVRSRGVMEKCTFCVQRIQEAKIEAKRRGESLLDGGIQPACQQSCPADAIVFGDRNDPQSRLSRLQASRRRYRVLEEFNFKPAVAYLAVVRNRRTAGGETNG